MNDTAYASQALAPQAIRIPTALWMVLAFAVLGLFLVTLDNGQVLQSSAHAVHEFMHDGRHLLGVPCH